MDKPKENRVLLAVVYVLSVAGIGVIVKTVFDNLDRFGMNIGAAVFGAMIVLGGAILLRLVEIFTGKLF